MADFKHLLSYIGQRIGKPPGWERLVRAVAPPERCRDIGEVCLIRDGLFFLARPSVPLGWHVTFFGSYEPEVRQIFSSILMPDAVAIDIGANIGWHSLLMGKLVGFKGRVLSVEANPAVRASLLQNIALNRLNHVDVIACALSDRNGTLAFHGPDTTDPESGNGHVVRDGNPIKSSMAIIEVRAQKLDDVVLAAGLARIDLIKIDVEGFEWPVLQGGAQAIARFRPHVVFEYDAAYAARGGGSPHEFAAFFNALGYHLFAIRRSWMQSLSEAPWPNCSNIWAVPATGVSAK